MKCNNLFFSHFRQLRSACAVETLLDIQFVTSKEQKNWTMLKKVHLEAVHRKLIPSRVGISQRVGPISMEKVHPEWKQCL